MSMLDTKVAPKPPKTHKGAIALISTPEMLQDVNGSNFIRQIHAAFNAAGRAIDPKMALPIWLALKSFPAKTPSKASWSSIGFVPVKGSDYLFCDGHHFHAKCEIHERIVPTDVINRTTLERVGEYIKRTGDEPNRKAIAELKSEVVAKLLADSLIKVREVPISFSVKNGSLYMVIYGTSPKVADNVINAFRDAILKVDPGQKLPFELLATVAGDGLYNFLNKAGFSEHGIPIESAEMFASVGKSITLDNGGDKITYRSPDEVESVSKLEKEGYAVIKANFNVAYMKEDGHYPALSLTLSNKGIFSGIKMASENSQLAELDQQDTRDGIEHIASRMLLVNDLLSVFDSLLSDEVKRDAMGRHIPFSFDTHVHGAELLDKLHADMLERGVGTEDTRSAAEIQDSFDFDDDDDETEQFIDDLHDDDDDEDFDFDDDEDDDWDEDNNEE